MDFLIHKLIWELRSADGATATKAQKLASELTDDREFLMELEQALLQVVPSHIQLRLERLEIELNWNDKNDLRKQLVDSISQAVKTAFQEDQKIAPKKTAQKMPVNRSLLEMVIAFIRLGNLPDRVPTEVRTVEQFLAYIHQEAKDDEALGSGLRSFLRENLTLLDEATKWPMVGLVKLLTNDADLAEKASALESGIGTLQSSLRTKRTIRKALLLEIITAKRAVDMRKVRHQLERLADGMDEKAKIEVLSMAIKLAPRGRRLKVKRVDSVKESAESEKLITSDLFIRNAGFVLSAPFLPPLLATLNLDTENPMHLPQIMRVFSFLDLGLQDEMGADLSLYRILMGLNPADQVFPSSKQLAEEQEEEVKGLLNEMLAHWKALKNTSPQGLRSNFFWRTGYLKSTTEGWRLKVETKAQDVLLAHLPWSIGIIKLPWMKKPLYVDWT